jgi:hypothetical protein
MMTETFEPREHSKAFNMPDTPAKVKSFASHILKHFRLVVVMGLSCTGKSTLVNAYGGRPGWTMTKWNRDQIWDMMFPDGRRVDKYYNKIDKFEKDLFPELLAREKHQIITEGWNRLPRSRTLYRQKMGDLVGRKAVVVFDGPIDAIIARNMAAQRLDMPDEEMRVFLKKQHEGIVWPSFDEGWDSILYVNTFGEKGTDYLTKYLVKG